MKKYYILALVLLGLTSCGVGKYSLIVENPLSIDRAGEIIEIEIADADQYVVYTQEGDALPCQTTYEGNLIFPATVAANASTKYTLQKGRRIAIDTLATGKLYPKRSDDFGWENDKIGFRTYSTTLGKNGDKLFGYDIFTKSYKRPVLDILYNTLLDDEYSSLKKSLRKTDPAGAAQLAAATTYHVDHGLGMDYYVVGPTLGSGTTALLQDGEIVYPGYFSSYDILDEGGLRLTFRLTYDPVEINGEMIQEVRTITLDQGTHFNYIEVDYQNLTKPSRVVAGLVMHDEGDVSLRGENFIAYAEPKHKFGWQTYNAVIYPEEVSNRIEYFESPKGDATGHVITEGEYTPGQTLKYFMGAAWNRWGFKTPESWFEHVEEQAQIKQNPLTYTIK